MTFVGSERAALERCPRPDEEIDARDGVVVPGLIDGHCHVGGGWSRFEPQDPGYRERLVLWGAGGAQAALAAGITTIADCGAPDDTSLLLRDAIRGRPRRRAAHPGLRAVADHDGRPRRLPSASP